jgi:transcriptional regulator with XRE-family HTH domain
MKKTNELPQAVNNLRAIWDKKKVEMQFTQVEAAKELGWSQGAISHYLNNITDLGPAAIIKFANFLTVSPLDIDPNIVQHLPDVQRYEITADTSDLTKRTRKTTYIKESTSSRWVSISEDTRFLDIDGSIDSGATDFGLVKVCNISDAPNAPYLLIVRKGEKCAHIYPKTIAPPEKDIKNKLAITQFLLTSDLRFDQ